MVHATIAQNNRSIRKLEPPPALVFQFCASLVCCTRDSSAAPQPLPAAQPAWELRNWEALGDGGCG